VTKSERTPSERMLPSVIGGPGGEGMTASPRTCLGGKNPEARRRGGREPSLSHKQTFVAGRVPRSAAGTSAVGNTRPRPMPAAGACGARRLTDANEPILPRNVHVGFGASPAPRLSDAPCFGNRVGSRGARQFGPHRRRRCRSRYRRRRSLSGRTIPNAVFSGGEPEVVKESDDPSAMRSPPVGCFSVAIVQQALRGNAKGKDVAAVSPQTTS
jgi:hypothetical protein